MFEFSSTQSHQTRIPFACAQLPQFDLFAILFDKLMHEVPEIQPSFGPEEKRYRLAIERADRFQNQQRQVQLACPGSGGLRHLRRKQTSLRVQFQVLGQRGAAIRGGLASSDFFGCQDPAEERSSTGRRYHGAGCLSQQAEELGRLPPIEGDRNYLRSCRHRFWSSSRVLTFASRNSRAWVSASSQARS